MEGSVTKRPHRTPEERAAEIDAQIAKMKASISEIESKKQSAISAFDEKIKAIQEKIKSLEQKKNDTLFPKPPKKTKKQKIQAILNKAQKNGMKPEEIAERLEISLED